jgi:hypothetical protein
VRPGAIGVAAASSNTVSMKFAWPKGLRHQRVIGSRPGWSVMRSPSNVTD